MFYSKWYATMTEAEAQCRRLAEADPECTRHMEPKDGGWIVYWGAF